jgi:hypothetical protein
MVKGAVFMYKKLVSIFGLFVVLTFLIMPAVTIGSATGIIARPADLVPRVKPTPSPDPTPVTGDGVVRKYAVVIGISDYATDANDLEYCDDDANDWKAYLVSQGYSVNLLLNTQASADNILAALQNLANNEDGDDCVAFVYSGHGYYYRTYRQSTIVSSDEYLILENTIEAITDTFESQHVFMFLDCCNAGTFSNIVNAGWVAGIGSTKSSYTYDGTADMKNGIYTYYAMEAVAAGYTTAEDICAYAEAYFEAATPGSASTIDNFVGAMDI